MTTPYARFYYDEIRRVIQTIIAAYLPGTDVETGIIGALVDAIAYDGHRASALLDRIAEGLSWDTIRTRAEAVALARLTGSSINQATPGGTDIVARLSSALAGAVTVLETLSRVGTSPTTDYESTSFEYLDDPVVAGPTGFTLHKTYIAAAYANYVPGAVFTPVGAGDAFYLGHANLMFDAVCLRQFGYLDGTYQMQLEYYDEAYVGSPDSVTDLGMGVLRFVLNTYFERTTTCAGLTVKCRLKSTGAEEPVVTIFTGTNRAETTTYLGQVVPSLIAADYEIEATWCPLPGVVTEARIGVPPATDLEQMHSPDDVTGFLSWTLPQLTDRNWIATTVNTVSAFWIRWRVTAFTAFTSLPAFNFLDVYSLSPIRTRYYTLFEATQGITVQDAIGNTDGTAFQKIRLSYTDLIDGSVSQVTVGTDSAYVQVASIYEASAFQKAYEIFEAPDGFYIRLGDGTLGALPPTAQLVTLVYRHAASLPGNAAAESINQAQLGMSYFDAVRNPRAATGWTAQEGSDAASLALLQATMPGRIRLYGRATTMDDYRELAEQWRSADERKPVSRAWGYEEEYGPKTVGLYVAGPAGALVTTTDRGLIEDYFNGTMIGPQKMGGVGLVNYEATVANYTPLVIAVTATIEVIAGYSAGVVDRVTAALQAYLSPLGVADDGSWRWEPGTKMSLAVLQNIIVQATGQRLVSSTIALPAADVVLADNELPLYGAITLTVVEV